MYLDFSEVDSFRHDFLTTGLHRALQYAFEGVGHGRRGETPDGLRAPAVSSNAGAVTTSAGAGAGQRGRTAAKACDEIANPIKEAVAVDQNFMMKVGR